MTTHHEPVDPVARERELRRLERERRRAARAAEGGASATRSARVASAPPEYADLPPVTTERARPRPEPEEVPRPRPGRAPDAPAQEEHDGPPAHAAPPARAARPPILAGIPWRRPSLLVGVAALVVGAATGYGLRGTGPSVHLHAVPSGDAITPAATTSLRVDVDVPSGKRGAVRVTVDGRDARADLQTLDGRLVLVPGALDEGTHVIRAALDRGSGRGTSVATWRFAVDGTPPRIRRTAPDSASRGKPVDLRVDVGDAVSVRWDDRDLPVRDGAVALRLDAPPEAPLVLVARDAAGNSARRVITVPVAARRPPRPVRAVHVSALAWATPSLRDPILRMIDRGEITAVELDLKDEAGVVGYDAHVPLARRIGALRPAYKLEDAVRVLHGKGVWIIGRIVAFRDPVLATASWRDPATRGRVVQTPSGGPYSGYGGFTNVADASVRDYNADIAEDAAARGVDDILYDYVRRPDGPISTMRFPGLRGTPEAAVAGFLAENQRRLAPRGTFLGASVFGIAATRPTEVAQDIPLIARSVDYVAPMVYPSHWAPGEYGVADPDADPRDIVRASVADFVKAARGTGARVVPWLQDFTLGRTYGAAEVRAQIDAARAAGADEFILWDPDVTYTEGALASEASSP